MTSSLVPSNLTMTPTFQCPLCQSDQGHVEQVIQAYRLVRCAACGGLSTFPIPGADALHALYDQSYYQGPEAARFTHPLADAVQRMFRWVRANAIRRRFGGTLRGRRILDIGCERGAMLAWLQRWGAEVDGVQISEPAAAVAAQSIGADRVWVGELAAANYPEASFDHVTLWHVLEHVPDPLALLREIRRILKPGGTAYVEVPNAGGWSARHFGAAWLAYDVPRHLVHFTPSVLQAVAQRAGLRCIEERHGSLEYSPVTLLQSLLNVLLGGEHWLFEALRQPSESRTWAERLRLAWHVVVAAVLAIPAIIMSWVLGVLHTGDTMGMYLVRAAEIS